MEATTLTSGVSAWFDATSLALFGRNEWPYYDGIPDRDPSRILPEDVHVTISMNSYVARADQVREIHRGLARYCDPILRDIPVNADIESFDPDLSVARTLFDAACKPRGVLLAVATKVLHRKRPAYIPMLDSVVIGAYADAMGKLVFKALAAENKEKAGSAGRAVMQAFRADLVVSTEQVDSLRDMHERQGSPMSKVRLLEVAVWMANEPRGYYRRASS